MLDGSLAGSPSLDPNLCFGKAHHRLCVSEGVDEEEGGRKDEGEEEEEMEGYKTVDTHSKCSPFFYVPPP